MPDGRLNVHSPEQGIWLGMISESGRRGGTGENEQASQHREERVGDSDSCIRHADSPSADSLLVAASWVIL